MSGQASEQPKSAWSRPQLERDRPIRTVGGFYRTADGSDAGIGGVPLTTAEDAVVSAVRLAYKVADAQIAQSMRLAQRLRKAGDRQAGEHSDRKALDATEQLVFRAMMGALAWVEAATATEEGSPLMRLLSSQYRLLGSLLGLSVTDRSNLSQSHPPDTEPAIPRTLSPAPAVSASQADRLRVVHTGKSRRPVLVKRFRLMRDGPVPETSLEFYSAESVEHDPIEAVLETDDGGRATLKLDTPRNAPTGLWKAAVCLDDDAQVGLVEIEL